jgi:serine/threonine protein kinase HipA of HipAB toxin-antitoxin module
MFAYLPQKTKHRITLEVETMDDFNPHQVDWEKLLEIQSGETVTAYVEDITPSDVW